ncbi:MAG: sugar porter family MFS transporter, partial [Bacteroidales bacterium]|nr:sugar porter family MFS transporter [Bacteroidales bacterium]
MKERRFNWNYLLSISLISAMGGLLFGYDWVVIGGAKPFYEPYFGIAGNPVMQGWVMSCALAGCLAGAVLSGWLSDSFGRKKLLILSAALFIVASIGTGSSNTLTSFISFRILGGIGIGLASNLSPMYIAEVTPAKIRGAFVSINQLTIVVGILLAQLINWRIAEPVPANSTIQEIAFSWNGQVAWRNMFFACAIPATMFFVLMWFVPESPRWLSKEIKGEIRAGRILSRIGGNEYADKELASIKETLRNAASGKSLHLIREPGIPRLLLTGIVIAVFQQWCGINVIFNYAQEIFANAGYSVSD